MLILWTCLVAAVGLVAVDADARCLTYEPAQVSLTGKLEMRNVPGPPSYRSLARGDLPEVIYVLLLDEPICVNGDPTSVQNKLGHAKVDEIQLVVKASRARTHVGKRVRATGELSAGQGSHHRTPVVLTVKGLRGA